LKPLWPSGSIEIVAAKADAHVGGRAAEAIVQRPELLGMERRREMREQAFC